MEASPVLNKLYISPDFAQHSGIASYAQVFFHHVLQPRGFEHRRFATLTAFDDYIAQLKTLPVFHVEVGVGTRTEQAILWRLLKMNAAVDVTLHDPPYVSFPHYRFGWHRLNQLSKAAQLVLPQRLFGRALLARARRVYVLSRRGAERVKDLNPTVDVRHIPLVTLVQPAGARTGPPALLYTGFIGPKKGLDYALALHAGLHAKHPELEMLVTGEPVDALTASYLARLKERYADGVRYTGYLAKSELAELLSGGHIAILPTHDYGTVCPVSANIMQALAASCVVVTTNANANAELVEPGVNGEFLSFDEKRDTAVLQRIIFDANLRQQMIHASRERVARDHSPQAVGRLIDDD